MGEEVKTGEETDRNDAGGTQVKMKIERCRRCKMDAIGRGDRRS